MNENSLSAYTNSSASSESFNDDEDKSSNGYPTINVILFITVIQIAQILLDWINTIKQPNCLLVSSLYQLKDGIVIGEYKSIGEACRIAKVGDDTIKRHIEDCKPDIHGYTWERI